MLRRGLGNFKLSPKPTGSILNGLQLKPKFHALFGGLMKLTPGKLAGLKNVSNDRGVIAAAAMDQRGSLQKSLAKEKGGDVSDAMMEEFKTLVTEVLTPHASAILLDPEWGLPASKRRAKNAGLLLAYEKTGYDKTGPGRIPDLLDLWSVKRLKEAGANCVKTVSYTHLRAHETPEHLVCR